MTDILNLDQARTRGRQFARLAIDMEYDVNSPKLFAPGEYGDNVMRRHLRIHEEGAMYDQAMRASYRAWIERARALGTRAYWSRPDRDWHRIHVQRRRE